MSRYALTIQLNTQDVHNINEAGQKITLVKEVGGSSGSEVTWVTFAPFENNQVIWSQEYGIYASSVEVQAGAEIMKTSAVNPAQSGLFYPFKTGAFSSPEGNAGENKYGIINSYSTKFTFGLAQSVTANGNKFTANPLNAVPVLSKEEATFIPIEKLRVFLSGNFNNGVVITNITSSALEVDMTTQPEVTIHYNQAQGRFIPGGLAVAA